MKTNKVATFGLLIALAFIFSYIETLIPLPIPIPGIKIGLANMVVVIAFMKLGDKDALILSLLRIILVSFTFGNLFSMVYSLSGGILSWLFMLIGKKTKKFSLVGISVLGGVFHNIGQIIVAIIVVENTKIAYYLPLLLVSGLITGALIGALASLILEHLKHI